MTNYAQLQQDFYAQEAADHAAGVHAQQKFKCSLCPMCASEMGVPAGYQMDDEMRQAQATHGPEQPT